MCFTLRPRATPFQAHCLAFLQSLSPPSITTNLSRTEQILKKSPLLSFRTLASALQISPLAIPPFSATFRPERQASHPAHLDQTHFQGHAWTLSFWSQTNTTSYFFSLRLAQPDIRCWCQECQACQASKVQRHIRAPLVKVPQPDRHLGSIHIDIVGPLSVSENETYLFTIVDRFTRWPEAIPLEDASTESCVRQGRRQELKFGGAKN